MKKVKIFYVAASLLLVTLGVFATKSRYYDSYVVYAEYFYSGLTPTYVVFSNNLTPGMSLIPDGCGEQIGGVTRSCFSFLLFYYDVSNPSTVPQKPVYANF